MKLCHIFAAIALPTLLSWSCAHEGGGRAGNNRGIPRDTVLTYDLRDLPDDKPCAPGIFLKYTRTVETLDDDWGSPEAHVGSGEYTYVTIFNAQDTQYLEVPKFDRNRGVPHEVTDGIYQDVRNRLEAEQPMPEERIFTIFCDDPRTILSDFERAHDAGYERVKAVLQTPHNGTYELESTNDGAFFIRRYIPPKKTEIFGGPARG